MEEESGLFLLNARIQNEVLQILMILLSLFLNVFIICQKSYGFIQL